MKKAKSIILSCMMCVGILSTSYLAVHAEETSKAVICNHDYNLYYEENFIRYGSNETQHWPEYTRLGRCGHCHAIVEVLGITAGDKKNHEWGGSTCGVCGKKR